MDFRSFEIALQYLIIFVRSIFFHYGNHGIFINKPDGIIDMSIRVIADNSILYPKYLVNSIIGFKIASIS